jgi:RNase H-fold protein (predicted Holliday junction resolvase)
LPRYFMGFDPGRDKCGVAIVADDQQVMLHEVVAATEVIQRLQALQGQYPIAALILGDQTSSKQWQKLLQAQWPDLQIVRVDERYSSLEARDRYWQYYPPQGLQRLVPAGMRTPPRPIDDLVAVILVERFLDSGIEPGN